MNKLRPIIHLTTSDESLADELEHMADFLHKEGYLLMWTYGKADAVRVLSPKKMKRADYRACVNAAKKILSDYH